MKMVFFAVVAFIPLHCSALADSTLTPSQMEALSPISAGAIGAVICNFNVNNSVARNRLAKTTDTATPEQLADATIIAVQTLSFLTTLGLLPADEAGRATYCAGMLKAFGSNGTTIPNLISK